MTTRDKVNIKVYLPLITREMGEGGGGGISYQVFKKGGLNRISIFREGSWEKGGDLFRGVAVFI